MDKKNILLSDSYIAGGAVALLLPALFSFLLYLLNFYLIHARALTQGNILLLGLGANLVVMRFYFLKFRCERTAKAILFLTFILVILYFIFLRGRSELLPL